MARMNTSSNLPKHLSVIQALSMFTMVILAVLSPTDAGPLPTPTTETNSVMASSDQSPESGMSWGDKTLSQSQAGLLFDTNQPASGLLPSNETSHQQVTDDEPNPEADECPLNEAVQQDWSDNRASTCPWTYVNHYDAHRYPSNIAHAVCRCQGCLDRNSGQQDPDMMCREVTYRMQVLRRNINEDGTEKYDFDWYEVPVACACMRPPTTPGIRPPGIIGF